MATLLMIESWLQSTGIALPRSIRERGHDYVLLTRDPATYPDDHPVKLLATDVVVADTNDHEALVASVRGLSAGRKIEGVLTTCDYYLEAAARCADALQLPGPSPEVMRMATGKHLVRDATRRAGLPTPRYAVADNWESALQAAAAIGFPLVAKPVDLNSGTSVQRVDDEADLKDAFWAISSVKHNTRGQSLAGVVLLEELLDGPEFSVEAVTHGGETRVLGITEKVVATPEFVELGHQVPARLDPASASELGAFACRALDALSFTHCVSHIEVKLTSSGPRMVEINPRQAGGYIFELVKLVTGTNPLDLLIDLALGCPPELSTRCQPGLVPSAAVCFALPPFAGMSSREAQALLDDPSIYRWELTPESSDQGVRDNNDRIGYVIAIDPDGNDALARAQEAVNKLGGRCRGQQSF